MSEKTFFQKIFVKGEANTFKAVENDEDINIDIEALGIFSKKLDTDDVVNILENKSTKVELKKEDNVLLEPIGGNGAFSGLIFEEHIGDNDDIIIEKKTFDIEVNKPESSEDLDETAKELIEFLKTDGDKKERVSDLLEKEEKIKEKEEKTDLDIPML